jgi:hypothetical protein
MPSRLRIHLFEQSSAAGARLPTKEIAELLARGDALLRTGDIASARLFYDRAASAGQGQAALRLGPPSIQRFSTGTPYAACVVIRPRLATGTSAREIGEAEAEHRSKSLKTKGEGRGTAMKPAINGRGTTWNPSCSAG